MNYDEFKSELLNFWVDNPEYRNFEFMILEKGYNLENAKKDNFSLTKGVDAFNEWMLGTNLKFFDVSSLDLIDDLLLIINKTNNNFSRCVIKELYDIYLKNKDWTEVIESVKVNIDFMNTVNTDILTKYSTDYDIIKSKLILRPLNYNDSIKKLTEGIYEKFNDMALTLYFDLGGYAKNTMVLSAMVPDSHLKEWGKSKEDVIYEARVNTFVNKPPRLYNMLDFPMTSDKYSIKGAFMAINIDINSQKYDIEKPLVLSTTQIKNGAIAIFYDGVKEKIAEILKGDFYFFIPDEDTVYIQTDRVGFDEFENFVNRIVLYPVGITIDQTMSKYIYKYNKSTKKIELCK